MWGTLIGGGDPTRERPLSVVAMMVDCLEPESPVQILILPLASFVASVSASV